MTQRVYLPSYLTEVAADHPLTPRTGYAVTAELRQANPDEDDEGLEYLAYAAACDADLAVLAHTPAAPRRRVVIAADLPDGELQATPAAGEGAIDVVAPIDWRTVVAFHIDDRDAIADVTQAIAGNPQALADLQERALMWYDATERNLVSDQA